MCCLISTVSFYRTASTFKPAHLVKCLVMASRMVQILTVTSSIMLNSAATFPHHATGPFTLQAVAATSTFHVPERVTQHIERATVELDAELAIMHRSYWSSYCYQGGALDPNTGCYHGLTVALPAFEEAADWIERQQCNVGLDCSDCYAAASDACDQPLAGPRKWVVSQELRRLENNNHFARHTCNLSWRCGIHTSVFPTFVTRRDGQWVAYTEHANGTEILLTDRLFWTLPDVVLKKTRSERVAVESIAVSCFQHGRENSTTTDNRPTLNCFDAQTGHFIEFTSDWQCSGKACYRLPNATRGRPDRQNANLRAASLEDLRRVVEGQHLLSEEMAVNVAALLQQVQRLQQIVRTAVMSLAKIDDRLIGNLLGNRAHSRFIGDQLFVLSANADPDTETSNCADGRIYKDGRWQPLVDAAECIVYTEPTALSLLQPLDVWLPERPPFEATGIAADFDGWSYFAQQKERLGMAVQFATTAQSSTSVGDLLDYPKGALNATVYGLLTTHMALIGGVVVLCCFVCRRPSNADGGRSKICLSVLKPTAVDFVGSKSNELKGRTTEL